MEATAEVIQTKMEVTNQSQPAILFDRYGFITFEEPKSAAAALKSLEHCICNQVIEDRTMMGQTADKKNDSGSLPSGSNENYPSKSSILCLNDDCVLHVCSFLPLDEVINLSKTCVRFSGIVETLFRYQRVLEIYEEDSISIKQLEYALLKGGHKLNKIKIYYTSLKKGVRCLEFISRFCPILKKLGLPCILIKELSVFTTPGLNLRHLTKLELVNTEYCIREEDCKILTALTNIKDLNLSHQPITGKYLDRFRNLLYLTLENCMDAKMYYFRLICENGMLKSLNITNCFNLPSACYTSESILNLKNLEKLFITSGYIPNADMNHICLLDSLKELTIRRELSQDRVHNDFFKQLTENKSEQLEGLTLTLLNLNSTVMGYIYQFKHLKKLYISMDRYISDSDLVRLGELKQLEQLGLAYCGYIQPEGLLNLFEQLTKIKELDIEGHGLITNKDIVKMAKVIKSRGTKSACTIYVKDTSVSRNIFKDPKYMEYAKFVKLSFESFFDKKGHFDHIG